MASILTVESENRRTLLLGQLSAALKANTAARLAEVQASGASTLSQKSIDLNNAMRAIQQRISDTKLATVIVPSLIPPAPVFNNVGGIPPVKIPSSLSAAAVKTLNAQIKAVFNDQVNYRNYVIAHNNNVNNTNKAIVTANTAIQNLVNNPGFFNRNVKKNRHIALGAITVAGMSGSNTGAWMSVQSTSAFNATWNYTPKNKKRLPPPLIPLVKQITVPDKPIEPAYFPVPMSSTGTAGPGADPEIAPYASYSADPGADPHRPYVSYSYSGGPVMIG